VTDTQYLQFDVGTEDDDQPVVAYWETGLLKGKDPDSWKSFKFVVTDYATNGGQVDITATVDKNEGLSAEATITPEEAAATGMIWGTGIWGTGIWGAATGTFRAYKKGERLAAVIDDNSPRHLQGYDLTVRISTATPNVQFELHEIAVLYLTKGVKRVVTQ
jgi:hypothetical protein